jgi:hypothetical protein
MLLNKPCDSGWEMRPDRRKTPVDLLTNIRDDWDIS